MIDFNKSKKEIIQFILNSKSPLLELEDLFSYYDTYEDRDLDEIENKKVLSILRNKKLIKLNLELKKIIDFNNTRFDVLSTNITVNNNYNFKKIHETMLIHGFDEGLRIQKQKLRIKKINNINNNLKK